MTEPLVSIIIPLYNGANYVEEAIQSALAQTYQNYEIIVVNDGSEDNGAGKMICERYADRISYYEKVNGGCASALNFGIRHAKGELISWLSHDDLYAPEKLEKQVSIYRERGLDTRKTIISSVGALIDAEGRSIAHPGRKSTGIYPPRQAFSYILNKICPNGCGLLIPKYCFETYGYFDESLRFVLDWALWLRFAYSGVSFFFDDTKLVYNRVHSMQVTVKQKELHKRESDHTVDQLFRQIKQAPEKQEYLQMLYYFSRASDYGDSASIYAFLKEKKIGISKWKCTRMRIVRKTILVAKWIYHHIR
jgi:glycosyltransferase involved in cell wall biosynthesis